MSGVSETHEFVFVSFFDRVDFIEPSAAGLEFYRRDIGPPSLVVSHLQCAAIDCAAVRRYALTYSMILLSVQLTSIAF